MLIVPENVDFLGRMFRCGDGSFHGISYPKMANSLWVRLVVAFWRNVVGTPGISFAQLETFDRSYSVANLSRSTLTPVSCNNANVLNFSGIKLQSNCRTKNFSRQVYPRKSTLVADSKKNQGSPQNICKSCSN